MNGLKIINACLISILLFAACKNKFNGQSINTGIDTLYSSSADLVNDTMTHQLPLVQTKLQADIQSLAQNLPVQLMRDSLKADELKAQTIAVSDPTFQTFMFEANTHNKQRTAIFSVKKALPSDYTKETRPICADGSCYKVEMYNYAVNATATAMVHNGSSKVVGISALPQTQPDIPESLKKIALQIATSSPEVIKALGLKPNEADALMASTKTALNRSRCERSQHLCVAPTFVQGEKALWAIVDLTDYKLVGIRWTNVGNAGPANKVVTERKIQNEKIVNCFCAVETPVDKNGWSFKYMLTSSDGLRIADVAFNKTPVINNAKLVDWHVSYSKSDGFGYSDAIGCPTFSSAAVVAIESPTVANLEDGGKVIGFVLEQKFYSEGWPKPCNYNYVQRYEFYNDGRFRVACASLGRGCGNDGTYRPVLRISLAGETNDFAEWNGTGWNNWAKENWQQQKELTAYSPEGFQYKWMNDAGGFYVEPGRGQFKDKGRGDNAFLYVTKRTGIDEGESDLVTIGPCCNTDYQQGPEKFIGTQPENIVKSGLVIWYVPQLKNDDTPGNEYCWAKSFLKNGVYTTQAYPCFAGPMFVPIKNVK
jgi:hypothetical protein